MVLPAALNGRRVPTVSVIAGHPRRQYRADAAGATSENKSLPWFAVCFQWSVVLLYNVVRQGQPHTSALPDRFIDDKRVINAVWQIMSLLIIASLLH